MYEVKRDEYISMSKDEKKVTKGRIRTNNRPTMQSLHSAERIGRLFSLFIKISYSLKQNLKRGVCERTNKFRLFFLLGLLRIQAIETSAK